MGANGVAQEDLMRPQAPTNFLGFQQQQQHAGHGVSCQVSITATTFTILILSSIAPDVLFGWKHHAEQREKRVRESNLIVFRFGK